MFCGRMDVEKSQRVPPFGIETFFDFSVTKGSHLQFFDVLQQWMFERKKKRKGPPFSASMAQLFGFSGTVEENTLTLRSPFAIFEP